ncbi:hypothetical protein CL633_03300 [bacterium]|nr:hypothetical protein [bacterium]|tara:strand:- start:3676 stop:4464 length:789 start_codon:yes stop_codon:yes gene_type:complete
MLSKKLIQQLKNIPEPRRKQYLFLAQNPRLREVFFAVETADKMREIGVKYHFPQEKITCLARTTGRVILGEVKYSEFSQALQKSCGLIPESAQSIANDVTKIIFAPISDELKKAHAYNIPEHLKTSIKKSEPSISIKTEESARENKPHWTAQDLKAEIDKNKQSLSSRKLENKKELSEPEITTPKPRPSIPYQPASTPNNLPTIETSKPTLHTMQSPEKTQSRLTQRAKNQTNDIYREPISSQDKSLPKPRLNGNVVDLKNI